MSRPRIFRKAEILDAARAAAETGLCASLLPTGEIQFTHVSKQRYAAGSSPARKRPEELLEGWLNENEAGGRA